MPVRSVLACVAILLALGACSAAPSVPRAGTVVTASNLPGPPAAAAAHAKPGWPMARDQWLGRYRMTWSSDPAFARSGLLTLFMRSITKPKAMVVPSGIMSVFGGDATTVLYLTKFGHVGSRAVADVNVGLFTSPPVGAIQLTAFGAASHTLTLKFTAAGRHQVELRFIRYSADPHP